MILIWNITANRTHDDAQHTQDWIELEFNTVNESERLFLAFYYISISMSFRCPPFIEEDHGEISQVLFALL